MLWENSSVAAAVVARSFLDNFSKKSLFLVIFMKNLHFGTYLFKMSFFTTKNLLFCEPLWGGIRATQLNLPTRLSTYLQGFQPTTIQKSDRIQYFRPTNQGLNLKTKQQTFKISEIISEIIGHRLTNTYITIHITIPIQNPIYFQRVRNWSRAEQSSRVEQSRVQQNINMGPI